MNTRSWLLAAAICTAVVTTQAGCMGPVPASTSDGQRSAGTPTYTVSQTSSGNMVYVSRSVNWTGVNFPQNWDLDLDKGTAAYRYFSRIDGSKQYEYAFHWRPLPLTMGGGFQFIYGCRIPFVGDQVSGDLHLGLGIVLGMLHSVPPAESVSVTSVNKQAVAAQKMIVLTPMTGVPVGTQASIQLQPQDGPRIIYNYEYR